MDVLELADACEFAQFRLDRRAGGLFRLVGVGQLQPVSIGSRALDLLQLLADRQGEIVVKQQIMATVWPGVIVEESNLTTQIAALRRVLDHGRSDGSCIQTVPSRGYRFLLPVRRITDDGGSPARQDCTAGSVLSVANKLALAASQAGTECKPIATTRRFTPGVATIATALLVTVVLAVAGLWRYGGWSDMPPRLSLAVMPFENLTNNADDNYLADGIADDLRNDLSHVPGAIVVGRASTSSYKGKAVAAAQIGRALGVRYLVEGSVRRLDSKLRVNVKLTSADTAATLWSDRFDEDMGDVAAGQDRVVARMRSGLGISLIDLESMRSLHERPTSPDAFDLVLQARSLLNQPTNEARSSAALALFERALSLDPVSVHALTGIAAVHIGKSMDQGQWLDPEAMARAEAMLAKARKIGPNSERVLMVSAAWLRSQDRCQELIEAAERLISLFPNAPTGYNFLGWCKMVNGHPEEELPLLDKMMQLDPVGPNVSGVYQRMAQDFNHLERSEDAIAMIERALAMNPGMRTEQRGNAYRVLAISHARLGHLDQARHWIEEGNKIRPFDTVRRYHFHGFANEGIERQMRSVREALRLAGLRDHAEEDADFGVKPSLRLHQGLEGQTPTTVPGATTIHTQELIRLIAQSKPLIVDTGYYPTGVSVPGAFELMHAGLAGNLSDTLQDRLRRVMHDLTRGDFAAPIVVVGWNSERFDGANLTVRLLKLGYRNILWYRGGREAWEVNNLPVGTPTLLEWFTVD